MKRTDLQKIEGQQRIYRRWPNDIGTPVNIVDATRHYKQPCRWRKDDRPEVSEIRTTGILVSSNDGKTFVVNTREIHDVTVEQWEAENAARQARAEERAAKYKAESDQREHIKNRLEHHLGGIDRNAPLMSLPLDDIARLIDKIETAQKRIDQLDNTIDFLADQLAHAHDE